MRIAVPSSVVFLVIVSTIESSCLTVKEAVDGLLNDSTYDSKSRPNLNLGAPDIVKVDLYIISIGRISEAEMEFTMSYYLRQRWVDARVNYSDTGLNTSHTLSATSIHRVWTPDVFISNLKEGSLHDITIPNKAVFIHPDGSITYSQKVTTTMSCYMTLKKYPMDEQKCVVNFESYAYNILEVRLDWFEDGGASMADDITQPDFDIVSFNTSQEIAVYSLGQFDRLVGVLHVTRRLSVYILSVYLPSGLLVAVSWMSFWIDLECVPARVSLAIITVLTLTTQTFSNNRGLFTTSIVKALDVWMSVCLGYVFAAFLEYALLHTLRQRHTGRRKIHPVHNVEPDSLMDDDDANTSCGFCRYWAHLWATNPSLFIDMVSRWLFPLTFLIFNCIYWPTYLTLESFID